LNTRLLPAAEQRPWGLLLDLASPDKAGERSMAAPIPADPSGSAGPQHRFAQVLDAAERPRWPTTVPRGLRALLRKDPPGRWERRRRQWLDAARALLKQAGGLDDGGIARHPR
jgi:hypothetical protein